MTRQLDRRRLVVLGSTGSIGRQTLDLALTHAERFSVVGLAVSRQADALAEQVAQFRPEWCAVAEPSAHSPRLAAAAESVGAQVLTGQDAAERLVDLAEPDVVLNAVSGLGGLGPALRALAGSAVLGMASKEPLVAAGLMLRQVERAGTATLVPVDSEPAGIHQCLADRNFCRLETVYLTASGGPFWQRDPRTLVNVTPDEATYHPRWRMGPKISVDSATMFNKGLEAIEISKLFDVGFDRIKIVVHPQSIAHALVEFADGSLLAQLGPTDMRVPISRAMFWPDQAPTAAARLDLDGLSLGFSYPDLTQWPCLRAALAAGTSGGCAPAVISAADEVLVDGFISGLVGFTDIGPGLWAALEAYWEQETPEQAGPGEPADIAVLLAADVWARSYAASWMDHNGSGAVLSPGPGKRM